MKPPKHGSQAQTKAFEPIKPSSHPRSNAGIPKGFKDPPPQMKKPLNVMKLPKLPGC